MPRWDGYVTPGDPSSGLLPHVHKIEGLKNGQGDRKIQAYNYRMCLTKDPALKIPLEKPEGYREIDHELLLRNFEAGDGRMPALIESLAGSGSKVDWNNMHAVGNDYVGANWEYPEGARDEPEAHLKAFTQDEIEIVLPVKPAKDAEGKPITYAWPYGGTTMVRIMDAAGKEWDVYFDRRLTLSPASRPGEEVKTVSNPETIYLNAYPSKPGSILVIDQKRFRDLVLSGIDH